jgi:hypothetical protein
LKIFDLTINEGLIMVYIDLDSQSCIGTIGSGLPPPVQGYNCDACTVLVNQGKYATTNDCNIGCTTIPPVAGKVCKDSDPLKIGCISGIPDTYIVAGAFFLIMMMKKK